MNDKRVTKYSKIGRFTCVDPSNKSAFRSMSYRFKVSPYQILDMKDICYKDSLTVHSPTPDDIKLTKVIRLNEPRLKYSFDMSCLHKKPMFTMEDGASMILPLDNKIGKDWLTYRDPVYKNFIYDLADRLVSFDPSLEEDAAMLLTDYSANVPYASIIRHDGSMEVKDDSWSDFNINTFQDKLTPYLKREFANYDFVDRPPINGIKSCGFDTAYPDGRRVKRKDFYVIPKDEHYSLQDLQLCCKFNMAPFKMHWVLSGAVQANLDWILSHAAEFNNEKVFLQAFERRCVAVHKEAYRTNNADQPKISLVNNSFRSSKGKGFKKDRDVCIEQKDGSFLSGLADDQAYSLKYRQLDPSASETFLKKRPMFPGNNASFFVPYIFLFRILVHRIEEGGFGFPSLNNMVMKRFCSFLSKPFKGSVIVSFDRRTSEQFITDNFEKVLKMFEPHLASLLKIVTTCVLPSDQGPRVVCGGLASGSAPTSFLNIIVGMFECCCMIWKSLVILGERCTLEGIIDDYLRIILRYYIALL